MNGLTVRWSPVSQVVGAAPILIEACDIVGVAEGGTGFSSQG